MRVRTFHDVGFNLTAVISSTTYLDCSLHLALLASDGLFYRNSSVYCSFLSSIRVSIVVSSLRCLNDNHSHVFHFSVCVLCFATTFHQHTWVVSLWFELFEHFMSHDTVHYTIQVVNCSYKTLTLLQYHIQMMILPHIHEWCSLHLQVSWTFANN